MLPPAVLHGLVLVREASPVGLVGSLHGLCIGSLRFLHLFLLIERGEA